MILPLDSSEFIASLNAAGVDPNRIDILTSIDGVDFDAAWRDRTAARWDGVDVNLIGRAHLIANKLATGRPRDLDDVMRLESR